MAPPETRADEDILIAVWWTFLRVGRASSQTLRRLSQGPNMVAPTELVEAGVTKLYRDRNFENLPSIRRLNRALESGSRGTRHMGQIKKQNPAQYAGGDLWSPRSAVTSLIA